MGWRSRWADRPYVQREKQFRNLRGDGISKGVLVAISIPIFTSQLEKSREATDQANLRSAYAEVMAAGLSEDSANYSKTVTAKQSDTSSWVSGSNPDIGGISVAPAASWTVAYDPDTQTVSIT